jgi:RNA polymerase sigma factor (sigma-70 family)
MALGGGQALAGFSTGEGLGTTISKVRGSVARFSRNDSQDIVQEALTRAVAHDVRGNLEPWLRTVSRRIAIDNSRRAREFAIGAADDMDKVSSPHSQSPEDVVLNNEGVGMIRRAMRSLPSRYRDALLAYSQDGDNGAVSAHFGISSNATCSLLSRARARLREELDRVGYAFGGIAMKLQRWHREVATAAAGACFVAVVAGSSGAAAMPAAPTATVRAPAAAAPAAVVQQAPAAAVVARAVPVVAPVRAVVRDVVKRTEVVRYQVVACGLRGKPVVAPYATIVKDEHPSIVGSLATKLPKLPVMDTGTCR